MKACLLFSLSKLIKSYNNYSFTCIGLSDYWYCSTIVNPKALCNILGEICRTATTTETPYCQDFMSLGIYDTAMQWFASYLEG